MSKFNLDCHIDHGYMRKNMIFLCFGIFICTLSSDMLSVFLLIQHQILLEIADFASTDFRTILSESQRTLPQIRNLVSYLSHCVFRQGRGTVDMIFTVRQLQKKSQNKIKLFIIFADLTKTFDTVNKDALWKISSKFGCPEKFVTIVQLRWE